MFTSRVSRLFNLLYSFIFDPKRSFVAIIHLFIAEVFVLFYVINHVKYTEIDWVAYMQEVEGVVNGTYNYFELKGDTGPLVYPAGFVYIYMALYYVTSHGVNIRLGQYIFAAFYLLNLLLVFNIYRKVQRVPPYVLVFLCCFSYRIHSIFVLRLFNDPVAMLLFYLAVNLFMENKWALGCIVYSLAVSVKMNVLLSAPGLLLLLILAHNFKRSLLYIGLCAMVQLLLGLPFLMVNPVAYIVRSFDLGRQFFFKWTVNWRFLPEEIFLNRYFHVSLLAIHLLILVLFLVYKWKPTYSQASQLLKMETLQPYARVLKYNYIVLTLFVSNFIGVCFSRSLHYQFYVWYFHTLHFLLWETNLPTMLRLLILGVVELCWNTYPSASLSSASLHACHFILLVSLYYNQTRSSVNVTKVVPESSKVK